MLSDRAVALARHAGDRAIRLRAEALALFASNRLGRGVAASGRALAAVRDAVAAGDAEVEAELRVELAWCASSAGSGEVAVRVLNPVLEQDRIAPEVRAHALLALAASLPAHGQDGDRSEALDEAEWLYEACGLSRDTARLLNARVRAARAAHRRRLGEFDEAIAVADAGLALLGQLGDPAADSGEMRARLVLERVLSLLELGRRPEAVQATESVLAQPVRAAAAGPVGWLGLAMATRVHLPDGNHGAAVRTLNDTAAISERHKLDGLLAETLNTLSHVHERGAEFPEALRALRGAYSADRRWRATVHTARVRLLAEYPVHSGGVEVPRQSSASPDPGPAGPEAAVLGLVGTRAAEPEQPEPAAPQPRRPEKGLREQGFPEQGFPEPSEPEQATSRHRSGYEETHDAARRLMETLTNRAAELREGGHRRQEPPEPRTAEEPEATEGAASQTVVFDSWALESQAAGIGQQDWQAAAEPADAQNARTIQVPEVEAVAFAEPADQGFPSHEPVSEEHAEPVATTAQASWWPSENPEQPQNAERTVPEVPVTHEPQPAESQQRLSVEFRPAESPSVEPLPSTAVLAAAADDIYRPVPAADDDHGAMDATAILPVIGGPAGSAEPVDLPGTGSAARNRPEESSPEGLHPRESRYGLSQYGRDLPGNDLPAIEQPGNYQVHDAPQDEPAHGSRETEPAAETPTGGTPAAEVTPASGTSVSEAPPGGTQRRQGGRRSRGKSLAEIRASLQLSAEPRSRRRARHADLAEPVESSDARETSDPAVAPPTPAAEVLGRHRQDWATEPNLLVVERHRTEELVGDGEAAEPPAAEPSAAEPPAAEPPAAEPPAAEPPAAEPPAVEASIVVPLAAELATAEQPGEEAPAAEPAAESAGEDAGPQGKIGLAELLTEALMAYESGRRAQPEAEETAPSGRHSEARVSGITGLPQVSHATHLSTSDDRGSGLAARHRRPAIDSTAVDPLF
ncbi:hypothetical protein [Saccharopolyspora sp. ASAGF58]|uniref:hypothetical protein n=1 Tax=Saccharopolyspora sp. ASAGF58 TaxID=2719023 RepID=UPI00143FC3FB|nr:hypothetical protein [Saccharopolyspora sp. ASAGF58]QIZ36284.1 hypothetical protein FDZ84_18390 [Saccharopolyspora sp. ASAGF58]